MDYVYMILAIVAGSFISLAGGSLIFTTKKSRDRAILLAMPFGAGALLAAAFFDLLPESFEAGDPSTLVLWTLAGFLTFFLLERTASWFHHHHEHDSDAIKHGGQRWLIVFGDLMHNAVDGAAIGASFLVSPATGVITVLAVSAHEIPKELGTFALLLSRGWKDKKVLFANIATAVATIITATTVYLLGSTEKLPVDIMLAVTAGFFIYIAASDIIPDIHEQKRQTGTLQAAILVAGVVLVGSLVTVIHDIMPNEHAHEAEHRLVEDEHDH